MRKIRSDIGDRMPEIKKYKENKRDVSNRTPENNESDPFKIMEDKLEVIYSSVISKNDPKLKRLEEDLQYLINTNLSLSKSTIEVDTYLIETYNKVIADIEKNFIDIVPEDLIEDLKDLKEQMSDDLVFEIIEYRLKVIQSSVISKNDPKLKRLEEDLQYLINTNLSLSKGTIEVDSNLIKTYNSVIADIEKNFIDIVPEDLEDLIEYLKIFKEQIFDDFKIMGNKLKRIYYSSVISENDPKLERIIKDIKKLKRIISSFSEDKIKLDSDLDSDLRDTYKEVIADLEKNFKLLSEESKVDIKNNLNFVPEDLIKDLNHLADLMLITHLKTHLKGIFKPFFPDDAFW